MATNPHTSVPQTNSYPPVSQKDEIIDEIHAFRESFAAQFNYDLSRMFEYLKEREATYPGLRADLVPLQPKRS